MHVQPPHPEAEGSALSLGLAPQSRNHPQDIASDVWPEIASLSSVFLDKNQLEQLRGTLPLNENDQRPEKLARAESQLQGSTLRYRDDDLLELSGKRLPLGRLLKKYPLTVVHFWATWCPACVAEMPYVDALWQKYRNHPSVGLIIISVDGDPLSAQRYAKDRGYRFPVYVDPNSFALASSVPNVPAREIAVPVTLIVTKEMKVSMGFLGPLTQTSAASIEAALSRVSAPAPSEQEK